MKIAEGFEIPDAALTQHISVLGKTGSGKTFCTKVVVEKLLTLHRRVVVIDPTGAWWGLRLNRAGDGPGFPVIILGGQHGDAPLPSASGAACAELVTAQAIQIVFDTSSMTVGERTRWFTDFAGGLFRLNRSPVHLVIDEAHMFAPQGGGGSMDPQTGKMLHAANTLASGGRSRGVRLMLLTQRPAKLHKDSLTCCDTLIAMKVIAPQDRKAIEEWVKGCGDLAKGKAVLESLAQLARGEGWVWYPEGGMLQRVKFPPITTFDSSATPEDGQTIAAPQTLASIDLGAVTAALAAAVEEAKASDPVELRKEILRLKKDLEAARAIKPQVAEPADTQERLSDAYSHGELSMLDLLEPLAKPCMHTLDQLAAALDAHAEAVKLFRTEMHRSRSIHDLDAPAPRGDTSPAEDDHGGSGPHVIPRLPRVAAPVRPAENGSARGHGTATVAPPGINQTQVRILQAIGAFWVMKIKPSRAMVALLAGIDPNGGHFSNSIGPLSTGGYCDQTADGIGLTAQGQEAWGGMTPIRLSDYHAAVWDVARKKSGRAGDILNQIISHGNKPISCTELGRTLSIDPDGGHFSNSIGPLSTLGLITRRSGVVTPTALLFPPGLK